MKTVIAKLVALWNRIPAPWQVWLRGLEVFVLTGAGTAATAALSGGNFTTRAGIFKYIAAVGGSALVCVRLYLAKSPVQTLLVQTLDPAATPAAK